MVEAHQDPVKLTHSFDQAYIWLANNGSTGLETRVGTQFEARAQTAQKGDHEGEDVIRFFQKGKEFARAYSCCWGKYYNCNRTRIGMYCVALDAAIDGA